MPVCVCVASNDDLLRIHLPALLKIVAVVTVTFATTLATWAAKYMPTGTVIFLDIRILQRRLVPAHGILLQRLTRAFSFLLRVGGGTLKFAPTA